jgi:guanylate kinase
LALNPAVNEMQHYDEFDYLVVNDDFDIALNELSTITNTQADSIKPLLLSISLNSFLDTKK